MSEQQTTDKFGVMATIPYAIGLVCVSACAPEGFSAERVEAEVNAQVPTGVESMWKISKDPTFAGGEPNPCQCNDDPTRKHWLLSC